MIRLSQRHLHECRSMNRQSPDRPRSPGQGSCWTEVLRDHSQVEIRALDAISATTPLEPIGQALLRCTDIISISVFGQVAGLPAEHPADSTAPIAQMGWLAVAHDPSGEHAVGTAELQAFDRGLRCRCDVVTERQWIGKGLGIVLMRHLLWISSLLGMQELRAWSVPEEHAVTDLLHALEFRASRDDAKPPQILHELHLNRRR